MKNPCQSTPELPKDSKVEAAPQTMPTTEPAVLPTATSSKTQEKKIKCQICKKRVGLTGFPCRCGGIFCAIHRYSDRHACNYNYKKAGAKAIKKDNPVIVAKKVQDI